MNRTLALVISCMLLGPLGEAQIANGSLAPNFSGIDLQGNSHDLYAMLSSGKGVVIDFSTAWCGPCIAMHRTHFFDVMNQNYGPEGTDEIVVLFLEADAATDLADLQGTGNYTVGDFTACTHLPILDNMQLAAGEYQVPFYPTFFVIDPSDSTTRMFSIFDHDSMLNYMVGAGIISQPVFDAGFGYECGANLTPLICDQANTYTPEFELFNFGSAPLTSLSFEIFINGAYHSTQSWTGNIASFRGEEVVLPAIPIVGNPNVSVVIDQVGDGNGGNDSLNWQIQRSAAITENLVTIEIQTDYLGAETYWQLTDPTGNVVASGGNPWVGTVNIGIGFGATGPQTPPGTYQSNQTYTHTVSLGSGTCYDFVITDYFGGGIRPSEGGYSVTDHLGNLLFSGAEFNTLVVHSFLSASPAGIDESLIESGLGLYPNPAKDQLHLRAAVGQAEIAIFDMRGRQVFRSEWNQNPIDLTPLGMGAYIVQVTSEQYRWIERFVKE